MLLWGVLKSIRCYSFVIVLEKKNADTFFLYFTSPGVCVSVIQVLCILSLIFYPWLWTITVDESIASMSCRLSQSTCYSGRLTCTTRAHRRVIHAVNHGLTRPPRHASTPEARVIARTAAVLSVPPMPPTRVYMVGNTPAPVVRSRCL